MEFASAGVSGVRFKGAVCYKGVVCLLSWYTTVYPCVRYVPLGWVVPNCVPLGWVPLGWVVPNCVCVCVCVCVSTHGFSSARVSSLRFMGTAWSGRALQSYNSLVCLLGWYTELYISMYMCDDIIHRTEWKIQVIVLMQ